MKIPDGTSLSSFETSSATFYKAGNRINSYPEVRRQSRFEDLGNHPPVVTLYAAIRILNKCLHLDGMSGN